MNSKVTTILIVEDQCLDQELHLEIMESSGLHVFGRFADFFIFTISEFLGTTPKKLLDIWDPILIGPIFLCDF